MAAAAAVIVVGWAEAGDQGRKGEAKGEATNPEGELMLSSMLSRVTGRSGGTMVRGRGGAGPGLPPSARPVEAGPLVGLGRNAEVMGWMRGWTAW